MSGLRPEIPDPIKREVRRQCGFGCVVCGLPLYEYHHMTPWADVRSHEAGNLTLLCPTHHTEATKGLLSDDAVASANEMPWAMSDGRTAPMRLLAGVKRIKVSLAGNTFEWSDSFRVLVVDGLPVIEIEHIDGHAFLSCDLRDSHNEPVMSVLRNEVVASSGSWDVEFVGTVFTIRSALRSIDLCIKFTSDGTVSVERLSMQFNGLAIHVTRNGSNVGDVLMTDCHFEAATGIDVSSG